MDLTQLSGLLSGAGQLGAAYYPYEASGEQIDYLKQLTEQAATQAPQIGQQAAEAAKFTPFAVKTATGGTTSVGAGGGYEQTLGATEQALQNQLMSQAGTLAGQAAPTAASLFQGMQTAQQGAADRARLELENRLAAQGRLGTQTSMYGGTPEALALEKALAEQTSQNYLASQQLAPQLAGQQLANIGSALGTSYMPQTQGLAALQAASPFAQISQAARQGQSEALYKGGIAGLESQIGGAGTVSALEGQRVNALADALSGLFASQTEYDPVTKTYKSAPSDLERILGLFS
jgi:hypothetical protein